MWKLMPLALALMACGFPRPLDVKPADDGGALPGVDSKTCMQTTCTGGMLEVCGASGTVEHTEQCALGCFPDESRCNEFVPSNGLGTSLDQSALQGPITLPAGAVVNTDTGAVVSQLGTPIQVTSVTVTQSDGAMLRVLLAQSWAINDVRILGTLPVAFVSSDEITVQGVIDASADGDTSGPGALICDSASGAGGIPGSGFFKRGPPGSSAGYPSLLYIINGFGGGGFGTAGGAGGLTDSAFAVAVAGPANGNAELVPLRGGCQGGGGHGSSDPDPPLHRGAGGGAIQFVGGRAVHLVAGGVVHVGGGRGVAGTLGRVSDTDTSPVWGPAGGGSGGGILIEAPNVVIDDGAALLATGGGGGGYGACNPAPDGVDAAPNASLPAGGVCPGGTNPAAAGGAGATTGTGAAGGATVATVWGSAGSGGGGLGRIRINTVDGLYTVSVNSLVRGVTTSGTVGRR
jgi:hypothetical protein